MCALFEHKCSFPSLICHCSLRNFYGGPLPSLRFQIVTFFARACVCVLLPWALPPPALVWLSDYYSLIVSHWMSRVFLFTTCCVFVCVGGRMFLLSDSHFLFIMLGHFIYTRARAFWLVRNCYCFGYYWRLLCFNNNVKKMRTRIMRRCSLFLSPFFSLIVLFLHFLFHHHFKVLLVRNFPKTALMLSNIRCCCQNCLFWWKFGVFFSRRVLNRTLYTLISSGTHFTQFNYKILSELNVETKQCF